MKVIAKVDSGRVLCEVTVEELAFLNGFPSMFDQGFNKAVKSEVGAECDIKRMVNTSKFVRSIRASTIEKTKQALERAINELDVAASTIAEAEVFAIIKDTETIEE